MFTSEFTFVFRFWLHTKFTTPSSKRLSVIIISSSSTTKTITTTKQEQRGGRTHISKGDHVRCYYRPTKRNEHFTSFNIFQHIIFWNPQLTSQLRSSHSRHVRTTMVENWNYIRKYTGCNRRNGPDFGRVFPRSNYTDITQNTYIQSSMVTEILAGEV